MMKTYTYEITTDNPQEMIDLSDIVVDVLKQSALKNGKIILFCPHTSAGLTINENADPDVRRDFIHALNKTFPIHGDYKHFEGNSHAHLKASFVGTDQMILVDQGAQLLGRWQSVFFCEFDGPRTRQLYLRTEGDYYG